MKEPVPTPAADLAELEARLNRLAREKAQLQLNTLLMSRLGELPGLESTAEGMVRMVMEILGGSNVTIYYRLDEKTRCVDVQGRKEVPGAIEDDLVREVFETREFVSRERDFHQTGMTTKEFTKATTWVIPLLVGTELVGVLRMEDLLVAGRDLRDELQTFLRYASLALKNEISRETRLRQAFAHLRFTECLDQINRAIQGTNDLETMMSDVLDAVLTIFECDRAFLVYPCDPETPTYRVPMERTRPEFPGALARGLEVPVDPESVQVFQSLRASSGPVTFGPGSEPPLPGHLKERFHVQSQIAMAVFPKVARPYLFGLHQCSHPRIWTLEETRLFQEIGRRLGDALTSLLTYRDLERSEERYRTLIQRIQAAVVVHGPDTRVITSNLMAQELLGLTEDQLLGKAAADPAWHFSRPDGSVIPLEEYPVNRVCESRKPLRDLVARIHRSTKEAASDVWVLVNADPVLGGHGEVLQVIVTFIDISELKRLETEQTRANRALRMLSDSNQALIRITDEGTLVNEVCRIAVEVGGYRMAWVGFAEHDDAKSVRPVARAGDGSEYLDTVTVSWADDENGRRPAGTAIRTGRPSIVHNIPEDPARAPWRAAAARRGYSSTIALPLASEGQTLGALVIYSGETNAFDPKEVEILGELAGDLAFGITALRTRAKRDRAEEALAAQHSTLRGIIDGTTSPIFSVDREYRFVAFNQSHVEIMRAVYGAEIALGRSMLDCMPAAEDRAEAKRNLDRALAGERLVERVHTGGEGRTRRSFEISHHPVRADDGSVIGAAVFVDDITEREQAERELRDSEEKFAAAFHASPNLMAITRKDGTILDVNEGYAKLLGYSREESVGKSTAALSIWADPGDRATFARSLAEGGEISDFETKLRCKDGTLVTVLDSARTIRLKDETCILSVVHDITERKLAETALRESEEKFAKAFLAASDSITIVDVETDRFLEVNDAFERLTGYSREEAIGRTTEELGIWADPAERQALTEILRRDRCLRDALARSRHRNGREFQAELSCDLIEIGGRLCVVGRARNVTERREAEEKIQMLLQAIEQSPVSVVITDADGRIEYVNRTFTEVTGYSAEEARGANPRLLKSGLTPTETYVELWQTLRAGGTWRGEFINRKRDGTLYWEQAWIAAVRDAAGRASHYVAVKEDVTARRRAQEELQTTRDQLHQAQKMESLGILAGGVAHDMNNVLAAIVSLADAVSGRHPEDEILGRALGTISGAALRGRTTVQRLLDFARPSISAERTVDIRGIVREQVALLERTTLSRVRVEVRLSPGDCLVQGDPGALSHALMNVCVNAVEAMTDGGLLIIGAHRRGDTVELSVADDGCGMEPRVLQRALDPFFTTKPQGKGTGLGLSVVYGVVKAHRGEMKIESEPGKGTTVTIVLPLAAAQEATPPEAGLPPDLRARGRKILVVDDDFAVRIAFSTLLEALGHFPTAVSSGEEALLAIEGGLEVDLVVLDLAMPGLGGAGTLPRLRDLRPTLPVILATGRADRNAAALAESFLGVRILEKPFNRKELEAVLDALPVDQQG